MKFSLGTIHWMTVKLSADGKIGSNLVDSAISVSLHLTFANTVEKSAAKCQVYSINKRFRNHCQISGFEPFGAFGINCQIKQ